MLAPLSLNFRHAKVPLLKTSLGQTPRLPILHRIARDFSKEHSLSTVEGGIMSVQIRPPIGSFAFVPALLVATSLGVGVPASAARAVDCLTAPGSSTPQNQHWYYRIDRAQQRKCWYLRAANGPSQQGPMQTAGEAPPGKPSQSLSTAAPYSLASFKDFMAYRGSTNLSDKDIEKLYAEFLEWSRHSKN
jgi:hypothetical protein